jgi:Domain of unknown function (DU1801).
MSFASLEEYRNNLDDKSMKSVDDFIAFMKAEFPTVTPRISFSMPMWWMGEKMYDGYVAISPAKKHYSIHFLDEEFILNLKKDLPKCTFGKRCINIKYDDEQAISVVKEYVKVYFARIKSE